MAVLIARILISVTLVQLLSASGGLAASTQLESGIDVSRYFSVVANSTCGEGGTPTSFMTAAGEVLNCTQGEHVASFILDGDQKTWWQSENNTTPVAITFSLQQVK